MNKETKLKTFRAFFSHQSDVVSLPTASYLLPWLIAVCYTSVTNDKARKFPTFCFVSSLLRKKKFLKASEKQKKKRDGIFFFRSFVCVGFSLNLIRINYEAHCESLSERTLKVSSASTLLIRGA